MARGRTPRRSDHQAMRGLSADRRRRACCSQPTSTRPMAESQLRPDLDPLAALPADRRPRHSALRRLVSDDAAQPGPEVPGQHGTLRDCIARVPDIAAMGFDVLLLHAHPPHWPHPPQGPQQCSRWRPKAIPARPMRSARREGGHDALHPELGTIEDFRALVATCLEYGLELALDFAVQCSPDHPWLTQHPEWFKWRPDRLGARRRMHAAIRTSSSPDFASRRTGTRWERVSRCHAVLDRPRRDHLRQSTITTPRRFPFWEWLIRDIRRRHPEVILFSKTFARPKLMKGLAKLGFAQSFSYFPWRTPRMGAGAISGRARPAIPSAISIRANLFVNTPDLLPYHLQGGEPWVFKSRVALAATLSGNYGIYSGFELLEHDAIPGREEYLDSEKYQIKQRDWDAAWQHQALYRRAQSHPQRERGASADGEFALPRRRGRRDHRLSSRRRSIQPTLSSTVIALSRHVREFWLPLGDLTIDVGGERRHVTALENLITRRTVPHRMGRDQIVYRS